MPSIRQLRAINNVIENNGDNIGRAMLQAGYPPNTAHNPKNLTESEAWNKLLRRYLPDSKIIAKHNEALEATKPVVAGNKVIQAPDHGIRIKAVELAYKVKGRLSDNIVVSSQTLIFDLGHNNEPIK